ncbi:MAG: hypothetical protein JO156_14510 [Solirubrobacterales bacterium]|nr:hypothetical protein [Solirubrobacterales bacterium]
MGLLDDAIREHLDLKRRRGADPTEVERAEREALGPVRRTPDEPPEAELENHQGPAYDQEDDRNWGQELFDDPAAPTVEDPDQPRHVRGQRDLEFEDQAEPLEPPPADDPLEQPDPLGPPAAPHGRAERPAAPPPDSEEPADPHPDSALDSEHEGEQTVEYDVERALEGSERDDVLEETPEFLQETPEHDRLWFEQRPPRDFDFDG